MPSTRNREIAAFSRQHGTLKIFGIVDETKGVDLTMIHHALGESAFFVIGVSIRFRRSIRVRDDKSVTDATTSDEVVDMSNKQTMVQEMSKLS